METFRDSIQGLDRIIDTDDKVEIIQSLLNVGYDFLDAGSFVSSKLIPQFADMDEVLGRIQPSARGTKLFILIANLAGAVKACKHEEIDILGYPFSASETFLKKNINAGFSESWKSLTEIQNECIQAGKDLMVYLAMAFGNPYGDPVSAELCYEWTDRLQNIGVKYIHLSDIIGIASPQQIAEYYGMLTREFPKITFGIHLHVKDNNWYPKIESAYKNGCLIFDGVISGLGGCPMTGYELIHNLPTSNLLSFAKEKKLQHGVDFQRFEECKSLILKKLISIA